MNPFRLILILFLTLPTVSAVGSAASLMTVTLKAQASVSDDQVTLEQVATIDATDGQRFSGLVIHRLVGETGELDIQTVRQTLLKQPGINPAFLSVKGHARCRLVRSVATAEPVGVEPSEDQASASGESAWVAGTLHQQIQDYFQQLTQWPDGQLAIRISGPPDQLAMPLTMSQRVEFEPQTTVFPGRCPLTVRVYQGLELRRTARFQVDVTRVCQGLVVTQSVARGEMVAADRLEARPVTLTVPGEPVTQITQAVGQMSRTLLRPGVVLLQEHLQTPYVVRRGDWVTVRCLSGELAVSITARAMSDAVVDQTIEVRNEHSRQTMSVRVVGSRQALLVGTPVADEPSGTGGDRGNRGNRGNRETHP